MTTLRRLSPIERIHERGMRAIIDGDNQRIVGEVTVGQVESKISELETEYSEVSEDSQGDIVFYRDIDDE